MSAVKFKLPEPGDRFTAKRKAALLAAVERGYLTKEEVFERYGLSVEELNLLRKKWEEYGLDGIKAKNQQNPARVRVRR